MSVPARIACTVTLAAFMLWAAPPRGVLLEDLSWLEAEKVLKPETVVVIPLGAQSKEHGPHLKLKNDWLMAEYLKRAVLAPCGCGGGAHAELRLTTPHSWTTPVPRRCAWRLPVTWWWTFAEPFRITVRSDSTF